MDIIIAIGSINAFFFAFLILTKSGKEISDKILIAWLVFFGINLLTGFCAVKTVFGNTIIPGILAAILFICHFPFLYLYAISLTRQNFKLNPKLLIHLIPVLLMTGSMIPFFRINGPEQTDIAYGYGDGVSLVILPMLVMIVSSAIYLAATIKTIRKHKYELDQKHCIPIHRIVFAHRSGFWITKLQATEYCYNRLYTIHGSCVDNLFYRIPWI